MSAQTVRYMNGSSKTFVRSLLNKLFIGQSHLSIMPYASAGVTWAELSFSGADELFTIKDSFKLTQADPTENDVKIDQSNELIDTISEKGDWTIEGNVPIVSKEILEPFFTSGATVAGTAPILGQSGTTYAAEAFFATPKTTYVTMLVENESENRGVAFARVKLTVGINYEGSTTPAYLKVSGKVLTNTESTGQQGDYAVCEKYSAS